MSSGRCYVTPNTLLPPRQKSLARPYNIIEVPSFRLRQSLLRRWGGRHRRPCRGSVLALASLPAEPAVDRSAGEVVCESGARVGRAIGKWSSVLTRICGSSGRIYFSQRRISDELGRFGPGSIMVGCYMRRSGSVTPGRSTVAVDLRRVRPAAMPTAVSSYSANVRYRPLRLKLWRAALRRGRAIWCPA